MTVFMTAQEEKYLANQPQWTENALPNPDQATPPHEAIPDPIEAERIWKLLVQSAEEWR